MLLKYFVPLLLLSSLGCEKENLAPAPPPPSDAYYPPTDAEEWETDAAGWDEAQASELYDFLATNGTRAFIVLKDGKIAAEKYWGKTIVGIGDFGPTSNWYWASAGKTLTAFLTGAAEKEGILNLADPTADYLGAGWTSMPPDRENAITVRNQLTMTTGLDYSNDLDCTAPACLTYRAEPGTQWFYHNAPYTLVGSVIAAAAGTSYEAYTAEKMSRFGIKGQWRTSGNNVVYWSTPREAARFGLLILREGKWAGQPELITPEYYRDMVSSSQSINPSYGYLWWLNGKEKVVYPGLEAAFPVSLAPSAPRDLFAALGKNGQFIDVVPSEGLVVIRLGEAPDEALVPVAFHDEMWKLIMRIVE